MYIVFHFVLLRKISFIPLHCVAQTPVIRGIGESFWELQCLLYNRMENNNNI